MLTASCANEIAVTDYSFEFTAGITYDNESNEYRLTLTRKSGSEANQYNVAFTHDGETSLSLTDMNGTTIERSFKERFDDTSSKTYILSKVNPGEHTLDLEISTDKFSQSISITYIVEDFSFLFDAKVIFDQSSKTHSLEVTLKEGAPADTYTLTFSIDNNEPRKTYQETFNEEIVKSYNLPLQEPGEHIVNLVISTGKHSQSIDLPYTVNDYSFDFKADIEYDSNNLSHILFLTLMKGSRGDSYTISYTVDGGYAVKLTDINGRELSASFTEDFIDATVRSYDLSRAAKGDHLMKMTISTDDYTQELEIPYEVVALPFSLHLETDTSGSSDTVLLLTMTEGDANTDYDAVLQIDGENQEEHFTVNFAKTPIHRITLPTMRPGKHDIKATLTDGHSQESASDSYSEPVRYPYLDITLEHNEQSGRHMARIGDNPYGIKLDISTSLTLTGKSTVCTSTFEYYQSDFTYKTYTKTMSDKNSCSGRYNDTSIILIDRDNLAMKLTSQYEMSNVMKYYPGQGDGECVEHDTWQKTGTERQYYSISNEDFKVDISGEKVTGVTLRITNNIGKMTLNGKESTSGTTKITL